MNDIQPKIYVTQDARHLNLAPAYEYGDEIVAMTPPGDANFSHQETLGALKRHMMNFRPEHDMLLLVGDPVVSMMAGAVYRHHHSDPLTVLKWDRMTGRYIRSVIDFNHDEEW